MRLLLTTDTAGGVWTFTAELAQGLVQRGHQVALLAFGLGCPMIAEPEGQGYRGVGDFEFHHVDIPLEWMQQNQTVQPQTTAAIQQLIRTFHPDLLHSNQFAAAATCADIPTLLTLHSDVLTWAEACQPDMPPSPWLDTYGSIVRAGLYGADLLTAPTRSYANDFTQLHHPVKPITVIPNGRSLPSAPYAERKLQAVTAGRLWDEGKGLSTLDKMNAPMPILIAGSLDHDGQQAAPPACATILGPLPQEALHQLFCESAIYLATSIYEPFGLAPLEAALCGCAVIARDLPSLREVWAEDALYFGNTAELAALLTTLQHQPELLAEAQVHAHARAAHFSADRMVDSYLETYDTLLSTPAPSGKLLTHAC